jgi:hypothetical protein
MDELATLQSATMAEQIHKRPELAKPTIDHIEKLIEIAARMRRWPELEQAVDALIEAKRAVVAWWDKHVPEQGRPKKNAAPALFSMADAEAQTGLKQYQISRLREVVEDPDSYRQHVIERARIEAGLDNERFEEAEEKDEERDPNARRPQPKRSGRDLWPTPASLIETVTLHVLPVLPDGAIWECAAGDGRLAEAIREAGRDTYASDIFPRRGIEKRDFLADDAIKDTIVLTNPPYNMTDRFIDHGLELMDDGTIKGLVLLLRHDHLQAGGRIEAFNRASLEVHCNWRPTWIVGTEAKSPRWSFHWIIWASGLRRRPPLYIKEPAA